MSYMEKVVTYVRRIGVALALIASAVCSDGPVNAPVPGRVGTEDGSSAYALKLYSKEGQDTKLLKIVPPSSLSGTHDTLAPLDRSPSSRRRLTVSPGAGPVKHALNVTECRQQRPGIQKTVLL
jgi:hypothetical protein